MPPFASAELARDSPLDELAVRHSISSVSLSSAPGSPRPHSLAILDAFPLPVNPDYETTEVPFHAGSASRSASSLAGTAAGSQEPIPRADPRFASDPAPEADHLRTAAAASESASAAAAAAPAGDPSMASRGDSEVEAPHLDEPFDSSMKPRHARVSSTDTILAPHDTQPLESPLSRTQKRYQRYGHSYSGSQGSVIPGGSPAKLIPPVLGPTWRSLALTPSSAPNSASSGVEPAFAKMAQLQPTSESPPARFPRRHSRVPSQPGLWRTQSPVFSPAVGSPRGTGPSESPRSRSSASSRESGSALGTESGPSHKVPLPPPHAHGSSQSWDASSAVRVRVSPLPSAAQHLLEGSAALAFDSRLTLEHWAAAASRFHSATGNLFLELGWAERWIPWTMIAGLDLPVKVLDVDLAELKYGAAPCMGLIADALHSFGVRLRVRQQDAAALRAFELAEALGSTEAAFSAAHLCMKGGRQVKKDVVKARNLLRRVNDI